jgi:hypothetical protein
MSVWTCLSFVTELTVRPDVIIAVLPVSLPSFVEMAGDTSTFQEGNGRRNENGSDYEVMECKDSRDCEYHSQSGPVFAWRCREYVGPG